jgi:hypothetical protein
LITDRFRWGILSAATPPPPEQSTQATPKQRLGVSLNRNENSGTFEMLEQRTNRGCTSKIICEFRREKTRANCVCSRKKTPHSETTNCALKMSLARSEES